MGTVPDCHGEEGDELVLKGNSTNIHQNLLQGIREYCILYVKTVV